MMRLISLVFIVVFFNGCLTPYDNEFICKPTIIGQCSTSIVESYDETIEKIDKEKNHEKIN